MERHVQRVVETLRTQQAQDKRQAGESSIQGHTRLDAKSGLVQTSRRRESDKGAEWRIRSKLKHNKNDSSFKFGLNFLLMLNFIL